MKEIVKVNWKEFDKLSAGERLVILETVLESVDDLDVKEFKTKLLKGLQSTNVVEIEQRSVYAYSKRK